MSPTVSAIEAEDLVKIYQGKSARPLRALDGLSLSVKQGEIFGLLGENAVEVFLSVEDNLTTYGRFHSIPRHEIGATAGRVIEQFGLGEFRKQKVIDLSGGLKRRVQVAGEPADMAR